MNLNFNNLFENNFNLEEEDDFKINSSEFTSSFPLFNFNILRNVESEEPFNLLNSNKVSEIIGEILHKKVKTESSFQIVPKKRGRKAIAKNVKAFDNPSITMREIIENDLAGVPMKSEIKMKEEKLRKMREKKALKKLERERGATSEVPAIENTIKVVNETFNSLASSLVPVFKEHELNFAPQIMFVDGKIVVNNNAREEKKLMTVTEAKPYKLTSMSFRTKNQTAKWTSEETRKFYKSIEIFGADFSMIAKLFPTRNRDQVKNKFHKEEKVNTFIMDEAFKKNKNMAKRSIMERIRAFSNNFANGGNMNNEVENLGFTQLERNFSNTSTDSMDLKIMDEIQEIFVKEIRPQSELLGLTEKRNALTEREENVEEKTVMKNEENSNRRISLLPNF